MAQGVAWSARELGVPARSSCPTTRRRPSSRPSSASAAEIVKVPFDRWWQVLVEHRYPGLDGLFIHPVADRA